MILGGTKRCPRRILHMCRSRWSLINIVLTSGHLPAVVFAVASLLAVAPFAAARPTLLAGRPVHSAAFRPAETGAWHECRNTGVIPTPVFWPWFELRSLRCYFRSSTRSTLLLPHAPYHHQNRGGKSRKSSCLGQLPQLGNYWVFLVSNRPSPEYASRVSSSHPVRACLKAVLFVSPPKRTLIPRNSPRQGGQPTPSSRRSM